MKVVVTDLNVIPAVSRFLKPGDILSAVTSVFSIFFAQCRDPIAALNLSGIARYCLNFHFGYCLESTKLLFFDIHLNEEIQTSDLLYHVSVAFDLQA